MCGIAGALDLTGTREFPAPRLRAMTAAIAHRGPDDEHHHREPGIALGARRLAIVDLHGGRQPLANEDRSVWDHGTATFDHARGQFAVALWDRPRRTLLLGRDRVGICPLYYAQADGWLLWGSEVKALLASGLV